MATELWLGPSGSEVLLPPVNWIGDPAEYPQSFKRNYDSATMLDGRIRYNFSGKSQRSWTLEWAMLTKANADVLQGLADLRQTLRFNHGMTAFKTWRNVTIAEFECHPLLATFRTGVVPKFQVSMTLEEEN